MSLAKWRVRTAGIIRRVGHVRLAVLALLFPVMTVAASPAPSTPAGLIAANIKATSLTLKWAASTGGAGGIAGYDVYQDGALLGSATTRTFAVAGLAPTTTYSLTVMARDGAGELSPPSAALAVTTAADTTAPAKPTTLAASDVTTSSFTLTWAASTDNVGVTGYNIYRSGAQIGTSSSTTFVLSGLAPDTNNRMTVRAADAAGNLSGASSALVVRTLADPPSIPTGLNVTNLKAASFTLKWTASTGGIGGITGYDVYQNGALAGTTTKKSFVFTGLTPVTNYILSVASRDSVGDVSDQSTPLVVTTPPDTAKPTVPTGLSASAVTHNSFTLQWAASTDNVNVAGYDVLKNNVVIGSTATTAFGVAGLAPLTTYSMRVKARDAAGNLSAASAILPVTTSVVPNVVPAVGLIAPANGSTFTVPLNLTLSATAADPDGSIAKVEFFGDAAKLGEVTTTSSPGIFTFPLTLTQPGRLDLTARATDNRNATTDSTPVTIRLLSGLPYIADFETVEGYTNGSLDGQHGWTVSAGTARVTDADAATGEQSVALDAGATAALIDQEFGAGVGNPAVVFLDLYAKPVAGIDAASGTLLDLDNARIGFVLNGVSGQFTVLDGDGKGTGTWKNQLPLLSLTSNQSPANWQRLSVRLDYTTRKWDFYLNGRLLVANLRFRFNNSAYFSGLSFQGHTAAGAGLDDLYAGPENPLFTDADHDGMDDAWETAHGLDPTVDDRENDFDGDGLTNIQEYVLGTDPSKSDTDNDGLTDGQEVALGTSPLIADTDGDGIPDGWEVQHGLNPMFDGDAALDSDGDGQSNLEEFQLGSDPGDYYNGSAPTITVLMGGNGAPGSNGSVQVLLTGAAGQPLASAPVTFSIAAGFSQLAASPDDGAPLIDTLPFRSLADGTAAVFYRTPLDQSPEGTIQVQAGATTVLLVYPPVDNQPTTVGLTAPADGTVLNGSSGVVFVATAQGSGGMVAKVQFFVDGAIVGESTAAPYYFLWSGPTAGSHVLTAQVTDNSGTTVTSPAVTITVSLSTPADAFYDFEASEGFSLGPLQGQGGWNGYTQGVLVTNDSAQSGSQSVVILPPPNGNGRYHASANLPQPSAGESVRYIDFWIKPVAGVSESLSDSSEIFPSDSPGFAFVRNGDTAELQAYESNEGLVSQWFAGFTVPVAVDGTALDWHRLTLRQDAVARKLDVYLDGRLALVDLPFFASGDQGFNIYGHATAPTRLDNLQVRTDNPLFADADRDGMDDAWEAAHGLDPTSNDRNGDPDHDGISNINEYKRGTSPAPPLDLDANGLSAQWKLQYFGQVTVDPAGDPDGDGLNNLQEFQLGTNPNGTDSDGDGMSDAQEVAFGTDPRDPASGLSTLAQWHATYTVNSTTPATTTYGPGVTGYTFGPTTDTGVRYRKITVKQTVTGSAYDNNGEFIVTAAYRAPGLWDVDGNPYGTITYAELGQWYFYPPKTVLEVQRDHPDATITDDGIAYTVQFTTDYYGIDPVSGFPNPFPNGLTTTRIVTEFSLSDPDQRVTTPGVALPASTYSADGIPAVGRDAYSSTTAQYYVTVPAGLTGTIHWFEIFTPANNPDGKQYTARSWLIDGTQTQSPTFALAAPANGSETVTLLNFKAQLAVDANHDGTIKLASEDDSDATSAGKPFRFWLNDDDDELVDSSQSGLYTEFEQDDRDVAVTHQADWTDNQISPNGTRDLEDFTRLWIDLSTLKDQIESGAIRVGLKWTDVSEGAPAIKLFRTDSADVTGSLKYLTDVTIANRQIEARAVYDVTLGGNDHTLIEGTGTLILGSFEFATNQLPSGKAHWLLEGCKVGKGQLRVVLLDQNGVEIGIGPGVWLDLREPKDFIERWSCGDDALGAVQPVVRVSSKSVSPAWENPSTEEEKDYLLYVHGYNMQEFEKQRWLETTYKRLWHLGYKGRVGSFSWPCSDSALPYDQSEERAWQSAAQLKALLSSLKTAGYRVHVLGHSQGNVVVGEALRQWKEAGNTDALVRTYVASQAAIQAHCYDPDAALIPDFAGSSSDDGTPNVYANYAPTRAPYLGVATVGGAAATWLNFENPEDYALTGNSLDVLNFHPGWQADQRLKPDQRFTYNSVDGFLELTTSGFTTLHLPADRFRIFSYAAEGRSLALGSTATSGVFSGGNTDLETTLGYSREHRFHSAQFRASNADGFEYWRRIMLGIGLQPFTP